MKRLLFLIFILVGIVAFGYWYYVSYIQVKTVHYHAGFQVYEHGRLKDFSDVKYMHLAPCIAGDSVGSKDDEQEKAHLHDRVGDVVHVHRSNARWGDLFRNLNYSVDTSSSVKGYVNGRRVENVLNYPIRPYDSLVLFIGEHEKVTVYLRNSIKKDYIMKNESRSEDCGS